MMPIYLAGRQSTTSGKRHTKRKKSVVFAEIYSSAIQGGRMKEHAHEERISPTMPEFEQQQRPEARMEEIEAEQETLLYVGNVTGATRIGQTARRATGPWSTTVHTLLRPFVGSGFLDAPRFLDAS